MELSRNDAPATVSPRILNIGLPCMWTAVPPLKFNGYTEYLPESFRYGLTPLSLRRVSSMRVFFISIPDITFFPPSPSTALTMYHLGPRFMYEYSSVTSFRGDMILFFRLVSLPRTILLLISSLSTENWFDHALSESFTYLYTTMSSGRSARHELSSESDARASPVYSSRMSIRFSIRVLTCLAALSVCPMLLPPTMDRANMVRERRNAPSARGLSDFFMLSIWLFVVIWLSFHYCECAVYLFCEYRPDHLV